MYALFFADFFPSSFFPNFYLLIIKFVRQGLRIIETCDIPGSEFLEKVFGESKNKFISVIWDQVRSGTKNPVMFLRHAARLSGLNRSCFWLPLNLVLYLLAPLLLLLPSSHRSSNSRLPPVPFIQIWNITPADKDNQEVPSVSHKGLVVHLKIENHVLPIPLGGLIQVAHNTLYVVTWIFFDVT
jgi:hypothetical protein